MLVSVLKIVSIGSEGLFSAICKTSSVQYLRLQALYLGRLQIVLNNTDAV